MQLNTRMKAQEVKMMMWGRRGLEHKDMQTSKTTACIALRATEVGLLTLCFCEALLAWHAYYCLLLVYTPRHSPRHSLPGMLVIAYCLLLVYTPATHKCCALNQAVTIYLLLRFCAFCGVESGTSRLGGFWWARRQGFHLAGKRQRRC